jgi:hypothetical protein
MDRYSRDNWKDLAIFRLTTLATCLAIFWIVGCRPGPPPSNEQVQQKAAQTTQQVKAGAQQAAADAKVAAANAVDKVNAVAAGVKQGLRRSTPSIPGAGTVDINSDSEARLITLPGITAARARRIIDNRPYAVPHDMVSKGVLSEAEYSRISGNVIAGSN